MSSYDNARLLAKLSAAQSAAADAMSRVANAQNLHEQALSDLAEAEERAHELETAVQSAVQDLATCRRALGEPTTATPLIADWLGKVIEDLSTILEAQDE